MATRHMTYQYDWGFITIDTNYETAPTGYFASFEVNMTEAEFIDEGADLRVVDGELVIVPVSELEG